MHGRSLALTTARSLTTKSWLGGGLCLAVTLAIWTAWIIYTRLGVTHSFEPADIVLLRCGIGGLIFLPFLIAQAPGLQRRAWFWGLAFAIAQGPLFIFAIAAGLRYAPAGYGAALAPGVMPLFAALLMAFAFGQRLRGWRVAGLVLILSGTTILALYGASLDANFALGCLLFLSAALMAAFYVVALPRSGLSPFIAAAMISVLSMTAFVPLYFAFGGGTLSAASGGEIAFQVLIQGVLMAVVSLLAYNGAIVLLGAARASAALALTPVATMAAAVPILGEIPHDFETFGAILISVGIVLASRAGRIGPAPAPLGS